jgi:hypothetical protein
MRAWKEDLVFRDEIAKVPEITSRLTPEKLAHAFDYTRQLANVDAIFQRVLSAPATSSPKPREVEKTELAMQHTGRKFRNPEE